VREIRDELVSAYRPERGEVERRRWRCWRLRLPGGARLGLAGLDCPVLVAPHAMPYCLDSLRRGCGFSCPAAEPAPCLAAAAWLLGRG
jgi:hypothetical protein